VAFQQQILENLDSARLSGITYPGGGNGLERTSSANLGQELYYASGWESIDAITFRLPDGVHDMREALRYMARERGLIDAQGTVNKPFSVKFSIALRDLCNKRVLIWQAPDLPNHVHRRFVRRPDPSCAVCDVPLPSRTLALRMRRQEFEDQPKDVADLAHAIVAVVTSHILQEPETGIDEALRALRLVQAELLGT
jgi:hypothetical protein